jgi:hypothetical protein
MTGTRPRWRTVTETRAGSSEIPVEPRRYTTACVLLKQPDKQKTSTKHVHKHDHFGHCVIYATALLISKTQS